jgi:hypothetical protein
MVPFNFALEANNLGRIFDLSLALHILVDLGLFLIVGDKPKSTLVIGGFLHTQHIVEFGFPFMTLYQVKGHVPPCVVLVINDNPYGLMFALSYICRTCP